MYKLRQLVGKRQTKRGTQEIAHPLDEILKEDSSKTNGWRRLGFVSRHDGAGITFHNGLSAGEKQEAHDAMAKLRKDNEGWETAGKFTAPPTVPEELLNQEEEDFDDE